MEKICCSSAVGWGISTKALPCCPTENHLKRILQIKCGFEYSVKFEGEDIGDWPSLFSPITFSNIQCLSIWCKTYAVPSAKISLDSMKIFCKYNFCDGCVW